MHAYSLVHDDLPCMDDDALRRGQPTVHVKWDEATAVLAGDALQTLAFELLAAPQGGIEPRLQARLILGLAQAAGAIGMVGGQALDLAAESAAAPLDLDQVTALQALKTGALIVWAAESGAILGRSDPEPLRRYAARRSAWRSRSATTSSTSRATPRPPASGCARTRGRARRPSWRCSASTAPGGRRVTWWRAHATVWRPTARRPGTCAPRRGSLSSAAADGAPGRSRGRPGQ